MLQAINTQGAILNLPLTDVSNGLVLQAMDGLNPVKANLVSSSFANIDGEQYQSSRREKRNIKIQLGLEPMYGGGSVGAMRTRLKSFFMPKTVVTLKFFQDDGPTLQISGRVESFDNAVFSKEPTVVISILCFDPDLVDPTVITVSGNTVADSTTFNVDYDGEVETGILFTLNVNRTEAEFTIYHTAPDGILRQLDFAAALVSGDVVTINTVVGAKYARLLHLSSTSSILRGISPTSNWIELQPGKNVLRVYTTGAAIPFTMQYTNKYGGL